jgi:hypothetical protein
MTLPLVEKDQTLWQRLYKSPWIDKLAPVIFIVGFMLVLLPNFAYVLDFEPSFWASVSALLAGGLILGVWLFISKHNRKYLEQAVPGTFKEFTALADATAYVIPDDGTVDDLQRLLTKYRKDQNVRYSVVIVSDYDRRNKHRLNVTAEQFRMLYERRNEHFDPSMLTPIGTEHTQ